MIETSHNEIPFFEKDIVPRVYDLTLQSPSDFKKCRVRIDRDAEGRFFGYMKVYATGSEAQWSVQSEELECDLEAIVWDGTRLSFARDTPQGKQTFTGHVVGSSVTGSYIYALSTSTFAWTGVRVELLSYGLIRKSMVDRSAWQAYVRSQLAQLMLAGNPIPIESKVLVQENAASPITATAWLPDRDDNPENWPQAYTITKLLLTFTITDPHRGPPIHRTVHARLAVPTTTPANGRPYPAVVALNGHEGSSYQALNPANSLYWYGDAFARRGYVVLAVDISHRPLSDRRIAIDRPPLYDDFLEGDDPLYGSHTRPAIASSLVGQFSDWEENGERAWDVMRTVDLLLSGQLHVQVDPQRLVITGLSMGGEIATLVGALDPRFSVVIPAGYSPDLNVMKYHGNHPCWQWLHREIGGYIDVSDLHALIAPRPLIIQTGRRDTTYSDFEPPFAADKQVARRSRIAYGEEVDKFIHYLHYDEHHYHFGDVNPTHPDAEHGVRQVAVIGPPTADWQTDGTTIEKPSLFTIVEELLTAHIRDHYHPF